MIKTSLDSITKRDFQLVTVLGQGAYGKVVLVRKVRGADKGKMYAMKTLKKKQIIKLKQVENTMTERKILEQVNHPFIIKMVYAFQNTEKLFYILEYCPGGELFFYLKQIGRFKETAAQFYAANVLLAFKHLHEKRILYRDLKPENVLVDQDGYLKITDFGLSKENVDQPVGYFDQNLDPSESPGNHVICGTAEYMSPEMLQGKGFGQATDWWSFGCLIYEMLTGRPPFMHESKDKLYKLIKYADPKLTFPFLSDEARDICTKLLDKDPLKRFGSLGNGALEVMSHPWFQGLNWDMIEAKQVKSPYTPQLEDETDVKYFDQEFTKMQLSPEQKIPDQKSKEELSVNSIKQKSQSPKSSYFLDMTPAQQIFPEPPVLPEFHNFTFSSEN